jgi:signal transduction histidine kinase
MVAARQSRSPALEDAVGQARSAALLDCLADAILIVDAEGRSVRANAAFEAVFGVAGGAAYDLDTLRERAAGGNVFSAEIDLPTPDGVRYFDVRTAPVRTPDGQCHGGVVVLSERPDRRLLHLHEEFMALASHELRSPLTALGGFVEMLARRLAPDLDERSQQHLERSQAQVRRLFDLVNELTDLSRLHSGKLELRQTQLDLAALLKQIAETAQALSAEHAVTLEVPPEPLWVVADAQRLEQVFMNLVGNAVKYAPDSDRIDLRAEAHDGQVVVCVQDYGPGIVEADRPQIFQRYFQARRPQGSPRAGLGLGLYIAREIMLAHGGDLALTASSGHGSIFSARLPLAR